MAYIYIPWLLFSQILLQVAKHEAKVPALIVFGDSTVDSGNNNRIKTLLKSNFKPYGRDFAGGQPTGRFSNGRVPPDFISEAFGLKPFVPAYLDLNYGISDFVTGVCFASAGTGYDNATSDVLCRQRTTKRVFLCNNVMGKRQCKIKICERCLKKRYVDITEEAAASDDWKCPKCCGICNCSVCMKREGKEPLGRAVPDSENPSEEEPAGVSEPNREEENQIEDVGKGKRKAKAPREPRRVKAKEEVVEPELPLPLGVPLTTVAGIELHPQDDVGHALQFIEFCVALKRFLSSAKKMLNLFSET